MARHTGNVRSTRDEPKVTCKLLSSIRDRLRSLLSESSVNPRSRRGREREKERKKEEEEEGTVLFSLFRGYTLPRVKCRVTVRLLLTSRPCLTANEHAVTSGCSPDERPATASIGDDTVWLFAVPLLAWWC